MNRYGLMVCICLVLGVSAHRGDSWGQPPGGNAPVSAYGVGWAAAHSDGGNSDYAPVKGPRNVTLAWRRKMPGAINLGVTADNNGRIYVTTSGKGCNLHCLDGKTGETLWCSSEVNKFAVASSALLDSEGRLFIGDNQAMYAFDSSGRRLWKTAIDGFPFSAQFTQTGGVVFLTCIGKIYVLDRRTGDHIVPPTPLAPDLAYRPDMDPRSCMRGTEECPYANTLAFDSKTGRLYFTLWIPGTKQASVVAMQYADTPAPAIRPLWTNSSLPGGSATSPDISSDGSRIYVNDNAGYVHALDAATGRGLWRYRIGYNPGGSQSTSPEGMLMPAGGGAATLMGIADRGDRADLVWRNANMQNRGIPAQAEGNLAYAIVKTGSLKNDLVVVDATTGAEIDRERLPGQTTFSVGTTIAPNGYIYVPTFTGVLFAFRPE